MIGNMEMYRVGSSGGGALCSILLAWVFTAANASAAASATPEMALQTLQTAYFHEDLEAAVAARDFVYEARASLLTERHLKNPDDDLVQRTAQVRQLSFRKQVHVEGFPAMRDRACSVTNQVPRGKDRVELTQDCVLADGAKSRQVWLAVKSPLGWRIADLSAE